MHWKGGTSEGVTEAVRRADGGGCQSGWGRLLSVTNAIEAGTWGSGDSGWASTGRPERGGGVSPPPFKCIPGEGAPPPSLGAAALRTTAVCPQNATAL